MNNFSHIYMIGIGGIGVSALARYFVRNHKVVAGYDRSPSQLTAQLESEGISVSYNETLAFSDPTFTDPSRTLVIYTPAVKEDNLYLSYFRSGGFRVIKRADALGEITKSLKTIAVAGTHGKTSVSCLIAHLMHNSAIGCTAILGGIPANYNTNFLWNPAAEIAVTEADEYDKSFLKLHPWFAVITSADADHLDIYGDKNTLLRSFAEFAANVHPEGLLLIKHGVGINTNILPVKQTSTYSLNDSRADVYAKNIAIHREKMFFDLIMPEATLRGLEMQALGMLNIENAVAACFISIRAGLNADEIRTGLKSFKGVHRRFQRQYISDEVVYIDDYAHHPEEIKALIKSVKAIYPGKKITGIFQPHLFSRTRDFADGFAESLSQLDEVILLDIYPAREKPIKNVTSKIIYDKINHSNKRLTSKENLPGLISNLSLEILLTMGAGDIDRLVVPIRSILEKKNKNQLQS